jgi:hypothetical protein
VRRCDLCGKRVWWPFQVAVVLNPTGKRGSGWIEHWKCYVGEELERDER